MEDETIVEHFNAERMRLKWQDPLYRAKMRKTQSENMKALNKREDIRPKRIENLNKRFEDHVLSEKRKEQAGKKP